MRLWDAVFDGRPDSEVEPDDHEQLTLKLSPGDAVLIEVALRMQQTLRAGDTVARLAGDEFVILLPHVADRHRASLAVRQHH